MSRAAAGYQADFMSRDLPTEIQIKQSSSIYIR